MQRTPLNKRSKTPKCKNCKQKFSPEHAYDFFCSDACISSFAKNARLKEAREDIKRMKEKHKDHGYYESKLQDEINAIVRLIDYGQVCISHGKHGKKVNAGHYHSVGANNSLRFHLENNFQQCESCNNYKGSNRSGYDKGLVETFGQEYFLRVNQDIVRENPIIKLSILELIDKIAIAKQIRAELVVAAKTYTAEERIELRRVYNQRIGIYK